MLTIYLTRYCVIHILPVQYDFYLEKSIWPIQATIVEIPTPVRDWKSAVMLFGVWFASTKPPRDLLLKPIVNQLENFMSSKIVIKQKDGMIDFFSQHYM